MSDFLDIPTLIAIVVAIVVIVRLRSVLGTRTGNERSPIERMRQRSGSEDNTNTDAKDGQSGTVIPMRPNTAPAEPNDERRSRKLEAEIERYAHADDSVAQGLRAIADADSSFMPKSFIEGAKSAYEMIVTAFAQGDRKTLKSLLDKDVYDGFEAAIAERESRGESIDFTFVGLPRVEISGAELDKKTAQVTIQYDAEVVSATKDKDGTLIEGNAEQVVTISDEWTFARTVRARDPNWKLVATNQLS